MKLSVVRADPAGNITLLVLTPVPVEKQARVAELLLAQEQWGAEQVGFVMPAPAGFDGCLRMAGGEFCGNASRAFGTWLAKQQGKSEPCEFTVSVSGSAVPVRVSVNPQAGAAAASMPVPLSVAERTVSGITGTLVHLGGIAHYVTEAAEPSLECFQQVEEQLFHTMQGLDAYGVIFLKGDRMTPLVKVPAANSLYWEGSCGSGSLAAAVAQAPDDGTFTRTYLQPAGKVEVTLVKQNGTLLHASIGGMVSLADPAEADVQYEAL